jgi:hypothetical protein
MHKTIKVCSKYISLILILCTTILWENGCIASQPSPDPVAGWTMLLSHDYLNLDKTIIQDYQNYIKSLSEDERQSIGPIQFFADGTGQHAVKIEIAHNGTDWGHVLIYDKENKRVKVIRYKIGKYAS